MRNKVNEYPGEKITIHYDLKRCIHSAECTRGLSSVFDINRKPWIDPNGAEADAIAEVITRCPTGALHFERKDKGPGEVAPNSHTISVGADGPLYLRGDFEVMDADGHVLLKDTRIALCRCGASKNKPLCDNTHKKVSFQAPGSLGENFAKTVESDDIEKTIAIKATAHGPLMIKGHVELVSADGQVRYQGNRMALCRCGGSSNKPFCDGTHAKIGFSGE